MYRFKNSIDVQKSPHFLVLIYRHTTMTSVHHPLFVHIWPKIKTGSYINSPNLKIVVRGEANK